MSGLKYAFNSDRKASDPERESTHYGSTHDHPGNSEGPSSKKDHQLKQGDGPKNLSLRRNDFLSAASRSLSHNNPAQANLIYALPAQTNLYQALSSLKSPDL
jgi:hypothetical protein